MANAFSYWIDKLASFLIDNNIPTSPSDFVMYAIESFHKLLFELLPSLLTNVVNGLFDILSNFLSSIQPLFASIGINISSQLFQSHGLDSSILTNNFVYFVVGFAFTVFVIKIAINIIISIIEIINVIIPG